MTFSDAIALALKNIKMLNYDGRWNEALAWAPQVQFSIKKWYDLFPGSSTTWNSHTVKLAKDFMNWNAAPMSWAENICHELKHTQQYRLWNDAAYQAKYLVDTSFRAAMEAEAECEGLRFLIRYHNITQGNLHPYLFKRIQDVLKDHFLGSKHYQTFYQAMTQAAQQEFAR